MADITHETRRHQTHRNRVTSAEWGFVWRLCVEVPRREQETAITYLGNKITEPIPTKGKIDFHHFTSESVYCKLADIGRNRAELEMIHAQAAFSQEGTG